MAAPPVPVLGSPGFVAVKAGLASGLALATCALVGNEDHVSAAFVAVVCVSPTVMIGFRRAASQLVGSALGGLFGTLALLARLEVVGIPVAVAASVYAALRGGLGTGWVVAAFTALFVQAVPRGVPTYTLGVRMEAVVLAVVAATAVNLLVSGWSYRTIFEKRLATLEAYVPKVLDHAASAGEAAYAPAFTVLAALDDELGHAVEELAWRRSADLGPVRLVRTRLASLRHLLHVALDLQERSIELGGRLTDVAGLVRWASAAVGEPPAVADALAGARDRLIAARRAL